MSYGVFRSDSMTGTVDGSQLESVRFYNGTAYADIENGRVVKLDSLITGEREIWKAVAPAANTPIADIVVIGGVETQYDERKKNLDEYINDKDTPARGYHPVTNNKFGVTADALDNDTGTTLAVGHIVELQADTKLKVVTAATNGSTVVGKIIAVEDAGRYTYYVIRVTA